MGAAALISFPLNEWLSETMPRHQILQLPAMFGLGIIAGHRFSKKLTLDAPWRIATLVFIMSSLIFWMLPRSVDLSVIDTSFNRVMHINMLTAGFFVVPALRNAILEIKIIFLGMTAAMITASGGVLLVFDLLLCSAFTIEQQRQTGQLMIIIGSTLYVYAFFVFFRGLRKNRITANQ